MCSCRTFVPMQEFAIGLIMLELYPDSLALVSLFGLLDGGAQLLAGASIGQYVDRCAAAAGNASKPAVQCGPQQASRVTLTEHLLRTRCSICDLGADCLETLMCRTERLRCAMSMYVLQNAAVATSTATALVSLSLLPGTLLFWVLVGCTVLMGSVSSVGAMGSTLSVEKEWTLALCGADSAALARLNAGDCHLLCPLQPKRLSR